MIISPMPPSLSHAGVALYSGFTGIIGISFGGIIFGGTINTGGLFGVEVGAGVAEGARITGIGDALYVDS